MVEDRTGLHLIYVQTVSDIENGWILVPREVLKQLTSFQSQGNKKDVINSKSFSLKRFF
jgi:sorting nexin-17